MAVFHRTSRGWNRVSGRRYVRAPTGPGTSIGPPHDPHARRADQRGRPSPPRPRRRPARATARPAASWPADRTDLAAQVVALVNAHRAQLGLQALVVSPALDAAATWKARNMAAYGYLDHDDPGPPAARTAAERVAACGYPDAEWAEDIATGYATAQAVVDGWLGSPEHRANIERPSSAPPASAPRGRRSTGRRPSASWPTRAASSPSPWSWPPRRRPPGRGGTGSSVAASRRRRDHRSA